MIETRPDDLLLGNGRREYKQSNYAVRAQTHYPKSYLLWVWEETAISYAKIRFFNSGLNSDPLLSTIESINLRIRLANAGQRVEMFHWNSGQLAQTGMIFYNQVIAAALGLKNICTFLSSMYSLLLSYTFPSSQILFPAKYSIAYNLKQQKMSLNTSTSAPER